MIARELLEILCCPETHQPVALAQARIIEKLNAAIAAGTVRNRAGKPVTGKLESGLLRADGMVIYPIRNRIPVMLIEEAIPLAQILPAAPHPV